MSSARRTLTGIGILLLVVVACSTYLHSVERKCEEAEGVYVQGHCLKVKEIHP
jgi:hypothetical protein